MNQRKLGSTTFPITFLLTLSSDRVTGAPGLSPVVTLSKNGGAFAAAAGAVVEIGDGWYALAGNATDRDTLGELALHATAATADPADQRYVIVPWDPFDANLGLARLDVAVGTREAEADAATRAAADITEHDATQSAIAALPGAPSAAAVAAAVWADATRTLTSIAATMDAQGYTAARAALLDRLDAAVSSRATPADTVAALLAYDGATDADLGATEAAIIAAIPAADMTVAEYLRTRRREYEYATEPTASYELIYDAAGTAPETRNRIYRDLSGGSVRNASDAIVRRDAEEAAP